MELKISLIAGVILTICIIPFIIMYRNAKRRETTLLKSLQDAATTTEDALSKYEVWSNIAVGINDSMTRFFAVRRNENEFRHYSMNLSDFNHCRLIEEKKKIKNTSSDEAEITENIRFEFMKRNQDGNREQIEIYNSKKDSLLLADERRLAISWCDIVNTAIQKL
ncbi:MAG: hypothetical protein IT242_11280 [Bacteroidia bacterium]|nr:hypothetical protein [Bacteroidia bacterium]